MAEFHVEHADWQLDQAALHNLRDLVFVREQQVPAEDEWDNLDHECEHVLALSRLGKAIGCGRLTPTHKIGRMAVLHDWRGRGVGTAMLRVLLERAREHGWDEVQLDAQVTALGFYRRFGFIVAGTEFIDAGIRHQSMRLVLDPLQAAPAQRGVLAQRPSPESLHCINLAQIKAAALKLIEHSRHRLAVHNRYLDPALLDDDDVLAGLRRVATSGRLANLRFLLLDPEHILRNGHRLVDLAQRLSSSIELRMLTERDDRNYPSAFMLNDVAGYLFQPMAGRPDGRGSTCAPAEYARLLNDFDEIWQRSVPATGLRLLGI